MIDKRAYSLLIKLINRDNSISISVYINSINMLWGKKLIENLVYY